MRLKSLLLIVVFAAASIPSDVAFNGQVAFAQDTTVQDRSEQNTAAPESEVQNRAAPTSEGQDPDAEALLERVREKYRAIDAIEASFQQVTETPYGDEPQTSGGRIVLREESYRVETGSQTFITDGQTTWIYTPSNEQVLVNDYVEDETSFSLNKFLFDTDEHYRVSATDTSTTGGETHYSLRLVPHNEGSFVKHIDVNVQAADALITQVDVLDVNDVRMQYNLTDITLNPSLPNGIFAFTAPDSVEVIDLRAE